MVGKLVVTGTIQQDESLVGYIVRLGHANGVSPVHLLHRAGLTPGFDYRPAELDALAELSRSDVARLQGASFAAASSDLKGQSFNGVRVMRPHLMTQGARVCAECLNESGYAARLWHLRAYVACHQHEGLLLDQCPSCLRPISWMRRFLNACDCGHLWMRGNDAPAEMVEISRRLAVAAEGREPAGAFDTIPRIVNVAWYFGVSMIADPRRRSSLSISSSNVATAIAVLTNGAPFVLDWHAAFERWAHHRFQAQRSRVGLHRDFGRELAMLKNSFGETSPFVIDEVRNYFSMHWQGYLFRRQSYFCVGPKVPRFLSVSDSARVLGVKAKRIWEFVDSGQIVVAEQVSGSRTYRVIRADGVETLRRHFASLLTPAEAAKALGISPHRFQQLQRAGLISSEQIISQTKRFNPKELHRFCTSLASLHRSINEAPVRITDVRTHSLIDLVTHVVAGRLTAWFGPGSANSLLNLYVDAREVEALGNRRVAGSKPGMMSARRATRLLRIGHPTLVALVKYKRAFAQWSEKGWLIAIAAQAVEQWQHTLVTSAVVAQSHGIAATSVTRRLQQLGIPAVLSADPSKKIASLWKRSDLDRVNFDAQWVTPSGQACALPKQARMKRLVRRAGPSIPVGSISLSQLAKRALIDTETLRHLTTHGYLQSTQLTKAGHLRGVTRSSAALFRRRYASSSEVAAKHGLKASAVTRRLRFLGVRPLLQLSSNSRIQMCWRRSDLRSIDFTKQYLLPCGRPSKPPMIVKAVLLTPRPSGSPRLPDAAIYVHVATGLLGTTSPSLRAAVDAGYVRAASRSVTDKVLAVVEADVLDFAARFVFTPKLAAELGLSVASVSRHLARLKVTPVWPRRRPVHALWERSSYDSHVLLNRWVTATGELSQQSSLFADPISDLGGQLSHND